MPPIQTIPLAQVNPASVSSIFIWSAVLLALVFLAFLAYAQFKRWMKDPEQSTGPGFTLSDLRELHRQGKMTKEEYEMARGKMVASAKKMADSMPDVLAGRRKPAEPPPQAPPEAGSHPPGTA
jgi:hypothetical protein